MGWEGWFTLAVVAVTVAALARERLPPALAVLGGTIVLLVAGVIDADQAFAGFSNEAPIVVGALLVLARAIEAAGFMQPVVTRLMGSGRGGPSQLVRLLLPTAGLSAFLNNTTIVAMAVPSVVAWAGRRAIPVSRFLMPISYAAVLGGVVTAIGTSTNLVVSGLLVEAGMAPLGLFELTPAGLPLALAGVVVLVLTAPWLLSVRRAAADSLRGAGREFTVSMRVAPGVLVGQTIEEAGLRHLQGVYLVQIDREDGQVIAAPAPDRRLDAGDVLTFAGRVGQIVDLQRQRGLVSTEERQLAKLGAAGDGFFEVVLGADSPLVGSTVRAAGFRTRYQAAVLAIHRAGERVDAKVGDVTLAVGDTLLLLAERGFRDRWRDSADFLLIAPLGDATIPRSGRGPIVLAVTAGLILVTGTGLVPLLQASLVTAVLLVATGALTARQARGAVDVNLLVLIAASFGLGAAVSRSGLADVVAGGLLAVFEPLGPVGALAGVLVATMLLTEVVSNNAAAVLLFPVALSTAARLGAEPRAFVMAVAFGASLSFLTPIGYQTNLMVYGPGGYRFSDYLRAGLPLNAVVVVLALWLIPRVWGL